jgi:hypothetical protein
VTSPVSPRALGWLLALVTVVGVMVNQREVGLALRVHEAHRLPALVADPQALLRAAAAHVDDVHVHL